MRKKNKTPAYYDYGKWEDDFGFLLLITNRKTAIATAFNVEAFAKMLTENNDFIHDKDVDDICSDTVNEIYSSLAPAYSDFLITKYFGTEKALITFIAEIVREEIIKTAVSSNNDKMRARFTDNKISKISDLNKKGES